MDIRTLGPLYHKNKNTNQELLSAENSTDMLKDITSILIFNS